jgi:uncharacterized protein YlxW (UPF0749 family)
MHGKILEAKEEELELLRVELKNSQDQNLSLQQKVQTLENQLENLKLLQSQTLTNLSQGQNFKSMDIGNNNTQNVDSDYKIVKKQQSDFKLTTTETKPSEETGEFDTST